MRISSVAGILSLLEESSTELKIFALTRLNGVVDEFWPEISYSLNTLEKIYEDVTFPRRSLAALILSKLNFHLGMYTIAASYALLAGDLFDVDEESEFVQRMLVELVEEYVLNSFDNAPVDEDLKSILDHMFNKCFGNETEKEAIGTALDSYKIEYVRQALSVSSNPKLLLDYTLDVAVEYIQELTFKEFVLQNLLCYYDHMDYLSSVNICKCLLVLDKTDEFMHVMDSMIRQNKTHFVYQMCFDLHQSGHQVYLFKMMREMCAIIERSYDMDLNEHLRKFYFVLTGRITQRLVHQFLLRSNNDGYKTLLKNILSTISGSMCHTAIVIANSFLYMGSGNIDFLMENIQWFEASTNWAKFTAYAAFGIIYKGNARQAKIILDVYCHRIKLAERYGGILYAAGLIASDYGVEVRNKFVTLLRHDMDDYSKYGNCLGVGLSAIGTGEQYLRDHLMATLGQDNGVVGEAAAIALGLVMIGSKDDETITTLIAYATNTQHDKTAQGIGLALALIMYETKDDADWLIHKLLNNENYVLREAAMLISGMAYCGEFEQVTIRQMLMATSRDARDEVKRAAVISLAFILYNAPEKKLSCVEMFVDNGNPEIRYAAAIALGIMFVGSGSKVATNILEKMIKLEKESFVRQGALIASSFILIQHSDHTAPNASKFRRMYLEIITSRHEDGVTKFGAILAQGIIDAGGRRVTLSLINNLGLTNMTAVAGMLLFTQYRNWYPMTLFLSLAFSPTHIVAVNKNFNMLKLNYIFPNPPQMKNEEDNYKQKQQQNTATNTNKNLETTSKINEHVPFCEVFTNPVCFTNQQLPYVILDENCPFVANKLVHYGGIVFMSNIQRAEEEFVDELTVNELPELPDEETTTLNHEPFHWNEDFN